MQDAAATTLATGAAGLLGWIAWPLAAPLAASSRWAAPVLFVAWRAGAAAIHTGVRAALSAR
ncbi:MAG: hypothetical protein QOE90_3661, partial [Thermoplasmata archaeon]|nr:hypothetical protein [Thermoplasmata archaeon]